MKMKSAFPVFVPSDESVGPGDICSVMGNKRGMTANHVVACAALSAKSVRASTGVIEDEYRMGFILVSDEQSVEHRDFKACASPELVHRLLFAFHCSMAVVFGEQAMREALQTERDADESEDFRRN